MRRLSREEVRARQLREMSEKDFQAHVLGLAAWEGWLSYHTHDSRRSQPGFPDLVLVRDGVMLVVELKKETGKVTKAQEEWLAALGQVDGIIVRVWRPSDMDEIQRTLSG